LFPHVFRPSAFPFFPGPLTALYLQSFLNRLFKHKVPINPSHPENPCSKYGLQYILWKRSTRHELCFFLFFSNSPCISPYFPAPRQKHLRPSPGTKKRPSMADGLLKRRPCAYTRLQSWMYSANSSSSTSKLA
jgi:hypothetical protein